MEGEGEKEAKRLIIFECCTSQVVWPTKWPVLTIADTVDSRAAAMYAASLHADI